MHLIRKCDYRIQTFVYYGNQSFTEVYMTDSYVCINCYWQWLHYTLSENTVIIFLPADNPIIEITKTADLPADKIKKTKAMSSPLL